MTSKKKTLQWLPMLLALAAPATSLCSCSNEDEGKRQQQPLFATEQKLQHIGIPLNVKIRTLSWK